MTTLLIIEDQERVLLAMKRALSRSYEVTACSDPREALALLLGGANFDIILSDFHMPGMTGRDLYYHLQRERPEVVQKLVFMSGAAESLHEFVREIGGSTPLLSKPLDLKELAKATAS